tara:strand:- start:522 stop:659 length:138 start_codon:yes stop_codon:yes gene_type:complete
MVGKQKNVVVNISMMIMCDASVVEGYDRRRSGLHNAPLHINMTTT